MYTQLITYKDALFIYMLLIQAIMKNKTLTSLNLRKNGLGTIGKQFIDIPNGEDCCLFIFNLGIYAL